MSAMSDSLKAVAAVSAVSGGLLYWKWRRMDSDLSTYFSRLQPEYFRDRIIWITGASSGIGEALCYHAASLNVGVKLVISARRHQLLQQLQERLIADCNMRRSDVFVLPMHLNTTDVTYLNDKYQSILRHFNVRSIDILVNNAGFSMRSVLVDFDDNDAVDMVQTNLTAPIVLSKLVLSDILSDESSSQQFGHIVNVSSVAARFLPATRSVYAATKSALLGFTYCLDQELKEHPNVNVSVILPGPVRTDVDIKAKGKHGREYGKRDAAIQSGQTVERCAELILRAVSNKKLESWPVSQPVLSAFYSAFYLSPGKYDGRNQISVQSLAAAGYKLQSKL